MQRIGGLISLIGGVKGPTTFNPSNGQSTAFVMLDESTNGIGQAIASKGNSVSNIGKNLGYGLSAVGFGLGTYDDVVYKGMDFSDAVGKNAISTGIGIGIGTGFAIGLVISNPIGWAAVGVAAGTIAISYAATKLYEWGYENFDVVKNVSNLVGDAIVGSMPVLSIMVQFF